MSIEGRQRLQELAKELKTFIGTRAHTVYKGNTERDLVVVEERIMDDELTNIADIFTLLDLRGQRKILKSNITLFEDTLSTLEDRIQELLTAETQMRENNENNE